jgi:hypothetical protein
MQMVFGDVSESQSPGFENADEFGKVAGVSFSDPFGQLPRHQCIGQSVGVIGRNEASGGLLAPLL